MFELIDMDVMSWQPKSSELNPIENMCGVLSQMSLYKREAGW